MHGQEENEKNYAFSTNSGWRGETSKIGAKRNLYLRLIFQKADFRANGI
jgi:hypothetical protein